MKTSVAIACCLALCAPVALRADDVLDRVDEALTLSGFNDDVRARLSGTLALEYYHFPQPAPGLIESDRNDLFNPRLTLFLDAQLGGHGYFFAQGRVDRGFDPGHENLQGRFDEYAFRYTPGSDGRLNFQIGKFATVVGNWVQRHQSWNNPFVTAPLPYENPTGIFDTIAANSAATLQHWAHTGPYAYETDHSLDRYRVPVIWGPSYASGGAVAGEIGKVDYAVEVKNAALSSRPDRWDAAQTQWQHPAFSGRIGYRPNEAWNLGFSASTGSYLDSQARPTLAPGHVLDDYRETVLGQDLGYAWHHLQFWAECYEARFAIPRVGDADTLAYYLEAKYKFAPQLFGALRWNQQLFGDIPDGRGGQVRWGRNAWRIDAATGYRFTAHTQLKGQYSLQHEDDSSRDFSSEWAMQFVVRF